MNYRYHPIIAELRLNEDGTEIYFNEVLLRSFENDKNRKTPTLKVNFHSRAHSVAKLVCETWNGLRENSALRVSKIDLLKGNHYSNLEWKEGASNGVGKFKQKINPSDIDDIIELLEGSKTIREIASIYNVDTATIGRIKNKYAKKD